MIIFSMITHDYISTVPLFNSVGIVVIIYVVIRIYTKNYPLPFTLTLYPLPVTLNPYPLPATRVLEMPLSAFKCERRTLAMAARKCNQM